jgi:hypothetical protein
MTGANDVDSTFLSLAKAVAAAIRHAAEETGE